MTQGERFNSIDILKGIMILFMLFVNTLYLPDILPVFSGRGPVTSGLKLSEWAISGFIFMFGMSVPFMITKKINTGFSAYEISRTIFSKSLILITIGILMVNAHRVNAGQTGFSPFAWAAILFIAIFLVWVRYPNEENNFFTSTGLRFFGLALIVFLIFKFRSGTFENNGSLIPGWWEVPGLLGWSYLVTAFTYLAFRNSFIGSSVIWMAFLSLYILSNLGMTDFVNPARPFIGPITDGCFPFIMLSGQLASLILKRYSENEFSKTLTRLAWYGILSLITGIVLKLTLLGSDENHNPAISLIINGIIIISFIPLHWLTDIKRKDHLFGFFKPAGENYLTTYLFPFIIFNLLFLCQVPVFFFRQFANTSLNIIASAFIAIFMMFLSSVVIKMNIRLKI
jgi:heparan-alpha-glucosaminide N-acetyltransferase